jgi:pimeloyl-ACP methyl ester carboxylesterase
VDVDEHTIELDGTPVFYRSAPSTGTPVLYLHGIPTSSDDWVALLQRTGGLAPDLIGFGRSGKAGNLEYSLDGHADFIERLLDELEITRVRLVVHDWGAGGGLVFAQRHPERVERLVLIDALPLLDGFHWARLARWWRRPAFGELLMGSIPKWLFNRTLRGACQAFTDVQLATAWEQFDQGTQRAILRLHRSASEEELARAGAGLSQLAAPTLVVWGEGDQWLTPSWGATYAGRLPNAVAHTVPGAGHWPWLEDAGALERVAAFVDGD